MSNYTDKTTVSLFVNGEQAKDEMEKLRKKAEELDKQLQAAMTAGDKKKAKSLQRELDQVNKAFNRTESAAKGTGVVLNNLSNSSIHGLRNALKYLRREISMTKPDTERWRDLANKIDSVKSRLKELNNEVEGSNSTWSKFKGWALSAWPALDLLSQWGGSVTDVIRDSVDAYASMDQEMANVRKFTGMTAEQVEDLNEEFKKIDTRTSREDLNKLAQEAGRLGKTSKEDILGFVRAADVINVALDDLGEGATLTLSKLTGIFGDEARYGTEQSLLKVGSVINELSQNCSASAPYLAEFASRMGGVGSQAKMTIPQIMGFGAVLDSNAQAVEASSTALSQVIVRMMQEPAKYAKVAGLDVQKFTEMLKTDTNGALILFLETLQKAGGMDVLSPMFKDMGETGSQAITALSTLAKHIDEVKAQQQVANQAFEEGTSAGNEFAVQNTTVQASLDKCKKAADEMRRELGGRLYPLMGHLLSSGAAIMQTLLTITKFILDNKGAVLSLTAAIVAYTVAVKYSAIAEKAHTALMNAKTLATSAYKVAVSLLTGQVKAATVAFKAFSATLKANPMGLVIGAVTLAIGALITWISKVKSANEEEKKAAEERKQRLLEYRSQITDINKASADYAAEEQSRLDKLYKATQDTTKGKKAQIAAVKELQKTYPQAFANLSTEEILAGKAASAYDALSKSIIKAARAKAAAEKIKENQKELLEIEMADEDAAKSGREALNKRAALRQKRREKEKQLPILVAEGRKTKKERAEIKEIDNDIDESATLLRNAANILRENKTKKAELKKANDYLAKIVAEAEAEDAKQPASPVTPYSGGGSDAAQPGAGGGRGRGGNASGVDEKFRKQLKAQMMIYQADMEDANEKALDSYIDKESDYEQLMKARHDNEIKYYNDSIDYFKKIFGEKKDAQIEDNADYQRLLADKKKADDEYNKWKLDADIKAIDTRSAAEEADARKEYDAKGDTSISAEIALQAKLFAIRKQALDEKLELYVAGTKEYEETRQQLDALETDKRLEQEKLYLDAVKKLREEYEQKSAAEKFKLEKAVLDELLKANKLSAEKYAEYLKALAEKYKADLPGAENNSSSWTSADQAKYDADVAALQGALNEQLISQEEYYGRVADLDKEAREKQFAGLKAAGGEWNSMLADVGLSIADLVQRISTGGDGLLGSLSATVGAVSAAVSAGMQIANQFAQAEAQIKTAALEKHYSREIELAQGNSYKVAKLEKKKEKEIAKIKSDASKKQFAMQVIQAIAQTATNALNAYGSALQIGGMAGLILAPIAAAVATAQGMVQVALLKKQQQASEAQGYSKGGFTRPGRVDEPAGIVHAGEWVASQKLLASPVARPMIDALDYAQRTNTIGSLRAEDVSRSIRANDTLARSADNGEPVALMTAAAAEMARTVSALKSRLDEPFVTVNTVTGDKGIKQAQDEYSRLMNNITPKSKRK